MTAAASAPGDGDGWTALLDHLAVVPRENGTPALDDAAAWLAARLTQSGLTPERFEWLAHPHRLRLVGAFALVAAIAYAIALPRSPRLALALAVLGPAALVAGLEFGVPSMGWLGSRPQVHLVAKVPPTEAIRARLIVSAHYDTKTDLLDHVERAPVTYAAPLVTLLMLVTTVVALTRRGAQQRWKSRLIRGTQGAALLNGLGLLAALTLGAVVPSRSPGALDNGASCAVLLKLGEALAQQPLKHTQVDLVFFSGEELGAEGSRAWVKSRFHAGVDLPTQAVNLDGVGAAEPLMVMRAESGLLRSFDYDSDLLRLVDFVHRERLGLGLHRAFYAGTTDARSILEGGIPSVSLASDLPGHALMRGLHSSADSRERVQLAALQSTLEILREVARRVDTRRAP